MTYNMATKLYPYYQDKLIWSAVPGIIVILITVFVGLFGNSNIIIATYRTKKLHTNCCILIAITAFFDIIHQLAHVIFAFRFFTVNYFINLENCYYLQLPFVFAMNFGSFAYLSVGLDRLCCVIFPLRYYDQLNRSYQLPYLLLMIALPTAYSISLLVLAYQRVMQSSTDMVVCFITDVFYEEMQHTWNVVQWITFAVTVTCYCVLWAFIRIKNAVYARKLTKTLTYIMGTLVFGWFITTFVGMTAAQTNASERTMFLIHTDFGWPANLGIAANYFIYYATNNEYRRAFRQQLKQTGLWGRSGVKRGQHLQNVYIIYPKKQFWSNITG